MLPLQEAWVQSLVRELRSHMQGSLKLNLKKKKKKSFYLKLTDKRKQNENPCLLNLSFHLAEILVATMCT